MEIVQTMTVLVLVAACGWVWLRRRKAADGGHRLTSPTLESAIVDVSECLGDTYRLAREQCSATDPVRKSLADAVVAVHDARRALQ